MEVSVVLLKFQVSCAVIFRIGSILIKMNYTRCSATAREAELSSQDEGMGVRGEGDILRGC